MFQYIQYLWVLSIVFGLLMVLSAVAIEPTATGNRQENTVPTNESRSVELSEGDAVRIRSLILDLGSGSFQVRRDAETELRKFDEQLLAYLKTAETPGSVEVRSRLRRLVRRIEMLEVTEGTWVLTTNAMPGETISTKSKTLRFLENGTFLHSGPTGNGVERWELNRAAKTFRLSYNDDYAVYEGTFTDGGDIVGKARNTDGREWHFHMTPADNNNSPGGGVTGDGKQEK